MKRFIAFIIVLTMAFTLCACGKSAPAATETPVVTDTPVAEAPVEQAPSGDRSMGEILMGEFLNEVSAGNTDPWTIADALLANEVIEFSGATVSVEPGYLAGFSSEIHDFQQGVMFAPMIGSIPFVGYVFVVDGDAAAFEQNLLDNADPRWNICVTAEETVSANVDNLVFFVMCP